MKQRFREAMQKELAPAGLHALLQGWADEVAPSARRDMQKWEQAFRTYPEWAERTDFTTFEQEVAYIRDWMVRRWEYLDTALQQPGP
jgi:hypothetical protein